MTTTISRAELAALCAPYPLDRHQGIRNIDGSILLTGPHRALISFVPCGVRISLPRQPLIVLPAHDIHDKERTGCRFAVLAHRGGSTVPATPAATLSVLKATLGRCLKLDMLAASRSVVRDGLDEARAGLKMGLPSLQAILARRSVALAAVAPDIIDAAARGRDADGERMRWQTTTVLAPCAGADQLVQAAIHLQLFRRRAERRLGIPPVPDMHRPLPPGVLRDRPETS